MRRDGGRSRIVPSHYGPTHAYAGSVYYVTNLNDSGPGSFRDAVSEPNRTVVLEVGGTITIDKRIHVAPNITIAREVTSLGTKARS